MITTKKHIPLRKTRLGIIIILSIIFSIFTFRYSYSQGHLTADSIPKAIKERLKTLYPQVNPESEDVWWSPYGLLPKGYWVNFVTDTRQIEIHFNENGDIVKTTNLSGDVGEYIKTPKEIKKTIDSIFPDAERVLCQAHGDEEWGHITKSNYSAQINDSNDYYISTYFALARYKYDAGQHTIRIDFEDKVLTEIVIENPDSTLLPLPITVYLKKHHPDCVTAVMIKYFENKKTKYQVTVGKDPKCGKQYTLNFNSSGKLKKSRSFNMTCGDFLVH